jgi:hypothetical protein
VPRGGGDHSSRAATLAARERERNVVELCLRGATFEQIGRQLNIDRSTAYKAWGRALKRLPKADVEAMRKMESERIRDLRFRVWNELAGRPDPNDPAKTVRPEPGLVIDLVDKAIKIARHEARLFGLDTSSTQQVVSTVVGQPISDEELDQGLARLTEQERDTFMMLLQKLQGRWVEPPPSSIETTASVVTTASESEPSKSGPEAEPQPVHGNQCDAPQARQQASSDGSGKSASNGDFAQRPASGSDIQLCPRCGR